MAAIPPMLLFIAFLLQSSFGLRRRSRDAKELTRLTFDDLATEHSSRHWVEASWANGPARGSLGPAWAMSNSTCEFPPRALQMCGCPWDWPWESYGASGICRKNDGSGHWQCARGWQGTDPPGCARVSYDACAIEIPDTTGPWAPCGPFPANNMNRTLLFKTGFFDLSYSVDGSWFQLMGNTKTIEQGDTIRLMYTKWGTQGYCGGTPDHDLGQGGYPVRVVRSGRYFAHYWIGGLRCGSEPALVEIRVWPDTFEITLRTYGGSQDVVPVIAGGQIYQSHPGQVQARFGVRWASGAWQAQQVWDTSSVGTVKVQPDLEAGSLPSELRIRKVFHWAWDGADLYFCADPADIPNGFPVAGSVLTADIVPANIALQATGPASRSEGHDSYYCGSDGVAYRLPLEKTETVESGSSAGGHVFMVAPPVEHELRVKRVFHWAWQGTSMYFCADPADVPSGFPVAGSALTAEIVPAEVTLKATGPAERSEHHDSVECSSNGLAYRLPLERTQDFASGSSSGSHALAIGLPVWDQVHGWFVKLFNHGSRSLLQNDAYRVNLRNPTDEPQPFRIQFHIDGPRGVPGIAAVVRDQSTLAPSGLHVQISKNWHSRSEWADVEYDGEWLTVVLMVELPARSELDFQLLLIYNYFGHLHSVSHAQLSLIGWAVNGVWEEIGLSSGGEAICYEPDGQHRRNTITDVRPFLVCGMYNEDGCTGSVDNPYWTGNHGGGDFLMAVDQAGSHQYLTDVSTRATTNGPRLTNVSYHGITADGALETVRTVSTWSTNDYARHLHSIQINVVRAGTYPRLTIYQVGSEYYNTMASLSFAYGNANGLIEERGVGYPGFAKHVPGYSRRSCDGAAPCWFALRSPDGAGMYAHRALIVRRWHAKIGGVEQPFAFSLMGVENNGVGLEISLPQGITALSPGDTISADFELVNYPKTAWGPSKKYFGPSERLKSWLSQAGGSFWYIALQDATRQPAVQVQKGSLERSFPPRIRVDQATQEAAFSLSGISAWPGAMPVSVSGVSRSDGGKLWYWRPDTQQWITFATGGDLQVDREMDDAHAFTYSLVFEESMPSMDSVALAFSATAPSAVLP